MGVNMDLSRYDALGEIEPGALKVRYSELRRQLQDLLSAPVKDMAAVDAVLVELDEVQAGYRDAHNRADDPQRF
jgi:hypothetical protein